MNAAAGGLSDWTFQAALAGYLTALVCYGIEFAARPGQARELAVGVAPGQLSSRVRFAAVPAAVQIGVLPGSRRRSWGDRFGRAAVVVTMIAALANVLSIGARALAAGRLPLANMYEFTSLICAAAATCWLVILRTTGARMLGFFVMVPVAVLAFVAGTVLYTPAGPIVPALNSYWKWIHVTTISLSASVLLVSGAASLMYLLRHRHDRRLPDEGAGSTNSMMDRLPSLLSLDRIAYRTATVAFPVYTFAIIAGSLWAEAAWGRYWGWDPKETTAFVSWVFYAVYLHARATAGWRGVRAAWISVLGFATIMFNLFFVNMVVSGLHSYAGLN